MIDNKIIYLKNKNTSFKNIQSLCFMIADWTLSKWNTSPKSHLCWIIQLYRHIEIPSGTRGDGAAKRGVKYCRFTSEDALEKTSRAGSGQSTRWVSTVCRHEHRTSVLQTIPKYWCFWKCFPVKSNYYWTGSLSLRCIDIVEHRSPNVLFRSTGVWSICWFQILWKEKDKML